MPEHLEHFILSPWSGIFHFLVAAEQSDNGVMVKQEQLSSPLLQVFSIHSTISVVFSLDLYKLSFVESKLNPSGSQASF